MITGSGLNLAGNGYISQVPTVHACGAICKEVTDCQYVSFNSNNQRCYLKDNRAHEGIVYGEGWKSANKDNCDIDIDCITESGWGRTGDFTIESNCSNILQVFAYSSSCLHIVY